MKRLSEDMPKSVQRAFAMVLIWCKENGYRLTATKTETKKK